MFLRSKFIKSCHRLFFLVPYRRVSSVEFQKLLEVKCDSSGEWCWWHRGRKYHDRQEEKRHQIAQSRHQIARICWSKLQSVCRLDRLDMRLGMVNMVMKKFVLNLLRGFNQYLELIQWTVITSINQNYRTCCIVMPEMTMLLQRLILAYACKR